MGAIRGLKLVSSLVLMLLMINFLGASEFSDNWFFAVFVFSSINMFLWGPFNELFRGKYLKVNLTSDDAVELLTTINFINILFCASALVITSIIFYFRPFSEHLYMLILLLPLLIAQQITATVTAILNCNEKYLTIELLGLLSQILAVVSFYFVFRYSQLTALLLTQALIVIIPYSYCAYWLESNFGDLCFNYRRIDATHLRLFFVGVLPLTVTYAFGVALGGLERVISMQLGAGVLTVVVYAVMIKSSIQSIFTSFILSFVLPGFDHKRGIKCHENQSVVYKSKGIIIFFMTLAVIVAVFLAKVPLLSSFSPNLSQDNSTKLLTIVPMYLVALMPIILYMLYGLLLASIGKERVYALVGIVMLLIQGITLVAYYKVSILAFPFSLFISGMFAFLTCYYHTGLSLRGLISDTILILLVFVVSYLIGASMIDTQLLSNFILPFSAYIVILSCYFFFRGGVDGVKVK